MLLISFSSLNPLLLQGVETLFLVFFGSTLTAEAREKLFFVLK